MSTIKMMKRSVWVTLMMNNRSDVGGLKTYERERVCRGAGV
jgi:hypothetical protein